MDNQGWVNRGSDNTIPTNYQGNNGVPSLAPIDHGGWVHQRGNNIIPTNQTYMSYISYEWNNGVPSLAPMGHQGQVHQGDDNIFQAIQTYVSYEGNTGVPSLGYIMNSQIPLHPTLIPISNMLEIPVIVNNQSYAFHHGNVEYGGNDWPLSMGYIRILQILSQPPLFLRFDCFPFSIVVEIPYGTVTLMQPFMHLPVLNETLQASPGINTSWPSNLPFFLPAFTVNSGDSRNIMLDPPTSLGNGVQDVINPSPLNQTLNVSGYVPFLSNYDSFNGIHVYHAPPWATGPQYPLRTAAAQIGRGPFNEMGTGSRGLSEVDILLHLMQEKFQPIIAGTSGTDECCCICQDNYADGDVLGKLECLHRYHFSCIKKWLMQKNTCPVCRHTALIVARPSS